MYNFVVLWWLLLNNTFLSEEHHVWMCTRFLVSSKLGIDPRLSRMSTGHPEVLGFRENKDIEKMVSFNLSRVIR